MFIPITWWTIVLGACSLLFVFALGLIWVVAEAKDEADTSGCALIILAVVLALTALAIAGWT